jgi:hypothetical protein
MMLCFNANSRTKSKLIFFSEIKEGCVLDSEIMNENEIMTISFNTIITNTSDTSLLLIFLFVFFALQELYEKVNSRN